MSRSVLLQANAVTPCGIRPDRIISLRKPLLWPQCTFGWWLLTAHLAGSAQISRVLCCLTLILAVGCGEGALVDQENSAGDSGQWRGRSGIIQDGPGQGMVVVASRVRASDEGRLSIGDQAPLLQVDEWIGPPTNPAQGGKVHAVLFWATWCEPAVRELPRFVRLSEQYGEDLQLTAISAESSEDIRQFLRRPSRPGNKIWKDLLQFPLAVDTQHRSEMLWQNAFEDLRLPLVFLCDQEGKLQWVGEPAGMEGPLQEMLAGDWDTLVAPELYRLENEIRRLYTSNNRGSARNEARKLVELRPHDSRLQMLYLEVLLREERYSEANPLAQKLSQQFSEDAELLNRLAWMVATAVDSPKRDLSAALDAAERAVALTREQDADMLDTLARVCFCLGETERAVQIQQQAVARAPESERSPYEGALQEYLSDGQTASDTQR